MVTTVTTRRSLSFTFRNFVAILFCPLWKCICTILLKYNILNKVNFVRTMSFYAKKKGKFDSAKFEGLWAFEDAKWKEESSLPNRTT